MTNLLSRILVVLLFLGATAPVADAAFAPGPRSIGSFYTPDDGALHAIVAKSNGDILETYWWETSSGFSSSVIAHFDGTVAVAGYYSPWDGYRHAVVARANGEIWDVQFHPCCGIFPVFVTSLSGWGDLKSMSAWTDPQHRLNIAFLTKWGALDVLGVHRQGGGGTTTTSFIKFIDNNAGIDVTGHHEVWNATSMVTVAAGSPTRLEQVYWYDSQLPEDYYDVYASSIQPWATRYANGATRTLKSLSATDQFCYFCPQWNGVEQIETLTSANALETFSTNNGGASLFWDQTFSSPTASVTGPFMTPFAGGQRRHTLVALANGQLWDIRATATTGTPVWSSNFLGWY